MRARSASHAASRRKCGPISHRATETALPSVARNVASTLLLASGFVIALTLVQNALVARALSNLPRLTTDFSPAYLRREMTSLAEGPPATLVLGDSVLWGYRIDPKDGAIALLRARGCSCVNLSFKGSSPPNYYAMLRFALASGVKPKSLLVEIDDEVFNPADGAYKTLNPSLAADALPYFDASDLAALEPPPARTGPVAKLDRTLETLWLVYAMRGDVRETLLGDTDEPPATDPTPDDYVGTYDLTPLTEQNIGVHYLEKTLDLARANGIPVVAFFSPANHRLLHEYIDGPEYRANLAFLRRILGARHARTIDLDASFPTREFFDDSHLTSAGQKRLAAALAPALE